MKKTEEYTKKKLRINKETLLNIDAKDLQNVNAGADTTGGHEMSGCAL